MPRINIELDFLTHRKTIAISPLAQLLFIRSLIYSATHLTDGFLPAQAIPLLAYDLTQYELATPEQPGVYAAPVIAVTIPELIAELLAVKRWSKKQANYQIHDYLDYQLSRKEVMELKENRRKSGQAGGRASAEARAIANRQAKCNGSSTEINPLTLPNPNPNPNLISDEEKKSISEPTHTNGFHPRKGKRAISDEDKPTEKHFSLGKTLNIDVGPEWGKFKNYCLAHDKRYANFEAAFRNWIANAADYKEKAHAVR